MNTTWLYHGSNVVVELLFGKLNDAFSVTLNVAILC